jgi:hypothetical protein
VKFDFRSSIFEFWERATARGRIGHLALMGPLQIDPVSRAMLTVLPLLTLTSKPTSRIHLAFS